MEERKFVIEMEGEQHPISYSDEALDSFTQKAAGVMDREIRTISDDRFGPEFYLKRSNRLGVLAPLIYNAIAQQDNNRVLLCVLWLATHFPEITGLEVDEGVIQYVQEEAIDPRLNGFERPEYLN
ncbi:MAG: hypothetical protein OQJ97_05735 [Rhodospirillales bacterium]|nr:hypothetical protein [Rhodospirillales bacterium]